MTTPSQQLASEKQRAAVKARGMSLVLSAGAGAGKTTTLIRRIFERIIDPEEPVDIDRFLILTFTRAAANEMKARLIAKVEEELAKASDNPTLRERLEGQLLRLPNARVSTIHSFCLDLITSYGDRIGLAPGFRLYSEEESSLFLDDYLSGKLEKALDERTHPFLFQLADYYNGLHGSDQLLAELKRFHLFLGSVSQPKNYLSLVNEFLNTTALDERALTQREEAYKCLLGIAASLDVLRAAASANPPATFNNTVQQLLSATASLTNGIRDIDQACETLDSILEHLPSSRYSISEKVMKTHPQLREEEPILKGLNALLKRLREILFLTDEKRLAEERDEINRLILPFFENCGVAWYEEYLNTLIENRTLTYNALERLAFQILSENEDVRQEVRDRYAEVYVDEFQDNSRLQDDLLALITHQTDEGGNLFLVGDIKQSIYRFRNAEPRVFLEHLSRSVPYDAQGGLQKQRISLVANFRSHPELLRHFNGLFSQLFEPKLSGFTFDEEHQFVAGKEERRSDPFAFEVHIRPKENGGETNGDNGENGEEEDENGDDPAVTESEARMIAQLIKARRLPFGETAILIRAPRRVISEYHRVFKEEAIPLDSRVPSSFIEQPEVVDFLSLVRCIDNPYSEIYLLAALRSPFFRWSNEELYQLRAMDHTALFFDLLTFDARLPESLKAKAKAAVSTIQHWQQRSQQTTVYSLFFEIIKETHYREKVIASRGDDGSLRALLEKAALYDSFDRAGLSDFLRFIDDLTRAQSRFETDPALPSTSDSVRIMSIHNSKGLEFKHVFVPEIAARFNNMDIVHSLLYTPDGELGWNFRSRTNKQAGTYTHNVVKEAIKNANKAEEIRLLYVAMTRAIQGLYLIGTVKDMKKRWKEVDTTNAETILAKATYLDWVIAYLKKAFGSCELEKDGSFEETRDGILFSINTGVESPSEETDLEKQGDLATPLVDRREGAKRRSQEPKVRAKLSVTEVKRLYEAQRDPLAAPFRPRCGGIRSQSDALEIGNITHQIMNELDFDFFTRSGDLNEELNRLQEKGIIPTERRASIPVDRIGWFLGTDLGKRMRRNGAKLLRERPITIGLPIRELFPDQQSEELLVFQGVLDALFEENGRWVVVDYKTDQCHGDEKRLETLVEDYGLQLNLYRVLLSRLLEIDPNTVECHLVFLDAPRVVTVMAKPFDAATLSALMERTAVGRPEVAAPSEPKLPANI